jgi:hypothetical protein
VAAVKGAAGRAGAAGARAGQLLLQVALGALSGVGLLWLLGMAWPPAQQWVGTAAAALAVALRTQPTAVLGLGAGILVVLAARALRGP